MRRIFLLLFLLLVNCNSIRYSKKTTEELPHLGAIGVFEKYALKNYLTQKTSVQLTEEIPLEMNLVRINKRNLFIKKGEKKVSDSLHYRFEISNQKLLLDKINADKRLIKYLKAGENFSIVTAVELKLNESQVRVLEKASWYSLAVDNSGREIVNLKSSTGEVGIIYPRESELINFNALDFCWGSAGRSKIEILDLVSNFESCNSGNYKSAKKAEKKYNFGFK